MSELGKEYRKQIAELEARITELEAERGTRIDKWMELIEEKDQEIERLRDPDWKTYIEITERWLEKYPPDIFTGISGDSGPLFVVAIRNAMAALQECDDG